VDHPDDIAVLVRDGFEIPGKSFSLTQGIDYYNGNYSDASLLCSLFVTNARLIKKIRGTSSTSIRVSPLGVKGTLVKYNVLC
jgi:hypothetical protein